MAFISGTIYSKALNMDTSFGAVLPHDSRKHMGIEEIHEGIEPSERPKTLILLHGLSDNWMAWAHRTSILRYAEDYDIAVLMPEVQRSFYQDMKNGPAYFTYVTEELPELATKMFNISVKPEDLMIAGLSMGGYGALACGLNLPERFFGIASFSGAMDLRQFVMDDIFASRKEINGWLKDRKGIFGESIEYPQNMDLYYLADKAEKCLTKPKVFMTCGTEDFLYETNVKFKNFMETKNFDYRFEEWSGIHEWGFWDKSIQIMLEHFLLKK